MDIGRTALRMVIGPLFVGHGTQKLFGWFGGHGLDGTAGFFENALGLKPGKRHAAAAGAAETIGGVLLTLGALTPVAAGLITGTMITAIRKVHAPKGPWVDRRGLRVQPRADRRDGGAHRDRSGPPVGRREPPFRASRATPWRWRSSPPPPPARRC